MLRGGKRNSNIYPKTLAHLPQICYICSRRTRAVNNEQKGVSKMINESDSSSKNEMCHKGMETAKEQSDTTRTLNKSNELSDLIGGLSR